MPKGLARHAYKSSWIRDLRKLDPYKINRHTDSYITINTPYNWPAFSSASYLNIGYVLSYKLIGIHN